MVSPAPQPLALVWFRDDLRLTDNAALTWASQHGHVVGLFIFEEIDAARPLGAAEAWWQRESVRKLHADLAQHGVNLIIAHGDPREIVPKIAAEQGATAVTWNRRYHLPFRDVDAQLKRTLAETCEVTSHPGYLLNEPWTVQTGSGTPFRVFTPYGKASQSMLIDAPPPLPIPHLHGTSGIGDAPTFDEPFWAAETLAKHCTTGEAQAQQKFRDFLEGLAGTSYKDNNDIPSADATSGLSAHLRFGEISPAQVWAETAAFADANHTVAADAWAFLRQLLWRDFAWHRLYYIPTLATHNVREQFNAFPWVWTDKAVPGSTPKAFAHPEMVPNDPDEAQHLGELAQWQKGETGIPMVDAGMRELWVTGTMHNRARMVAGSWLTKNLGIHWRHGTPMYPEPIVDVKESRKIALAAYDDVKN
nr:deoxyribodipyrimidine photolyase [Streptococcus thermophilus]